MAKTVWKQREFEDWVLQKTVDAFTEVGEEAKEFVKRNTPVRTGFARRSVYFVIIDERGIPISGDIHDENGNPVPRSFPAAGRIQVIVGANAPYYIWIEIGTRGRPGRAALARAADLIQQRIMMKLREERSSG